MDGYRHEPTPPSEQEARAWAEELANFDFPDFCTPPLDAWEYIIAKYKKMRVLHQGDKIRPEEDYSITTVCYAFFAWLFDEGGSEWLLQLFGVEEVEPHHGYRYWYGGKPHADGSHLIGDETDSKLRIFIKNPVNRYQDSPSEDQDNIDRMKTILCKLYVPKDKEPMFATVGMWRWALTELRNWFTETPDKYWPYNKSDRVGGMQWATQLKDPWSPTDRMWSALEMTEKYRPRAFRIEQDGGVVWCGRQQLASEPLDVFDYKEGMKAIRTGYLSITGDKLIEKIKTNFSCESCDRVICCVTSIQKGRNGEQERLCDNCFGGQVESGDRYTLDNCTYRECFECPHHIRSTDDLKNLKHQLRQEYNWPVQR